MAEEDDDSGFSISDAVTGTGEESNRSTSSGPSSQKDPRTAVYVKGDYGTTRYDPDTECKFCEEIAEGVLIGRDPGTEDTDGMKTGIPLCKTHRREMDSRPRINLDKYPYKTFR